MPARAQNPLAPKTTSTTSAATTDPLGRDNPHGTVLGFVRSATEENFEEAIRYFQPMPKGHRSTVEQEEELASQLLTILNDRFPASVLDSISHDPQGRVENGLASDREKVSSSSAISDSFSLELVRVDDSHGNKLWFISRETLDAVPEIYDSLRFPQIEKKLPRLLVKNRLLAMPLWQWLAIVLFAPIALALGWVIGFAALEAAQRIRKARGLEPLPRQPLSHIGPGTLLVAAIIHYFFVFLIGTSLLYRQYYRRVIWVFLAFAFYWGVTRITRRVAADIWKRLTDRNRLAERSLVALTRRVLDVAIFLVIALLILSSFGFNVTTALAGLGIGGLAIGLGAQKTFENLLGGISILTDRALVVGDPCKIGDRAGTVEDIGLRSTKLRTEDRTLVSIPNGTVATANLENFRFRDKILFRQLLRLRYDLAPDHVRYVLSELREVLKNHPKVDAASARATLLRMGENAIETEVYGYILERDYGQFLVVQEQLILQVMDVLEQTGAALALFGESTVVTKDAWVDPEKIAAAKKAMEKKSDPGVPGSHHPELAPDGGKANPKSGITR
jgi:MscS family membrane protein